MSFFSRSSRLIFRRAPVLVPVAFILGALIVTWFSSYRITCTFLDNRCCVRIELIGTTFAIPLMVSYLIMFFMVFPLLHISIFRWVVCKRCSSYFSNAQHSLPYIIAGLTTALQSLIFSVLARITPDRSLRRHNATCYDITEPKYLALFTDGGVSSNCNTPC